HEIKHDGYRLIARKREGRVRLFTRNGFDWSDRYPRISEAVAALRALQAVLDGEAVWCDRAGLALFDKLHSRASCRVRALGLPASQNFLMIASTSSHVTPTSKSDWRFFPAPKRGKDATTNSSSPPIKPHVVASKPSDGCPRNFP